MEPSEPIDRGHASHAGPADTGTLNLRWCAHFVAGLAAAGVREVVISPGSRSTPLALACLRHPGLHCEIVLDERSAAFFALGLAKSGGKPVALVCTSGTAAANWLPAVVEASKSCVPLLLCTADRPPELQDWDANQTIEQIGLFGAHVRGCHAPGAPTADCDPAWLQQLAHKVVAQSRWPHPGPVHLNFAFREPLLPVGSDFVIEFPILSGKTEALPTLPTLMPAASEIARLATHLGPPRGLILCGEGPYGEDFPETVTRLAEHLAVPVIAESLSGLRFGAHDRQRICSRYADWLTGEAEAVDWVLRFGRFPITRQLQSCLAKIPTQLLVARFGRWSDPQHRTTLRVHGDESAVCNALLAALPQARNATWSDSLCAQDAAARPPAASAPLEARLFAQLCASLPDGTRLFCGNSLPIRDLDAWSGSGPNSLELLANRGASGIDGNIATAAGVASGGPTIAVLGDLTAQHDIGSLALMRGRPLVVIVINNGGGGIFDLLPQATLPEFETAWRTPQHLDFGHAAQAFGINYQLLESADETVAMACAARTAKSPLLIELRVDRHANLERRKSNAQGRASD